MKQILAPEELEARLGEGIRAMRLQKNLDQKSLSVRAGISVSALKHLESGQGSAVKTLVRVIKALDREDWLFSVTPEISINPLHMVKKVAARQRASRKLNGKSKKN